MDWSDRIGRRLKPRDLHIFLAVAEAGTMAKAAEALGCSRPVVSKTIADLEAMLRVRLLDRTAQGIEPTQYGRALLARSVAIFDELRKGVQEIEFLAEPGTGEVRIGCVEPLMAGIASAAIAQLAGTHPRMTFKTEIGNRHLQPQFLRSRQCEVCLSRAVLGVHDPDIEEEPLFHERLLVVTSAQHPLARRRKLTLQDLADSPWILSSPEAEPGGPVVEAFGEAGLDMVEARIFSYSLSFRYSLLVKGPYVTCIPASTIQFGPRPDFLRVLPIDIPPWRQPTVMMTLKDRSRSPAAEALMDCVRNFAAQMRQS